MSEFEIHIQDDGTGEPGDPRGLSIRAKGLSLTRLLREDSSEPDDFVQVPLTELAFWLAEHWWRLRWECPPLGVFTPEWRLAHDVASIGGGFAWPRILLWGEGHRVVLVSRADSAGAVGPVRFLSNAITFVHASQFEATVDSFMARACQEASKVDRPVLRSLLDALQTERSDPDASKWRRLEAMAGYNPDEAPDSLMEALEALSDLYRSQDVEEAVAAMPGTEAASTLQTLLFNTRGSSFDEVNFEDAIRVGVRELGDQVDEPWSVAEIVADALRRQYGFGSKPIRNTKLAELTGSSSKLFGERPPLQTVPPYGLRVSDDSSSNSRILLRSRRGEARRFDVARCLGDAIWTRNSAFGPVSRADTARQKFQRAFAANLLCPAGALVRFLGTDSPSDSQLSEASKYFHVSERVIRSVLVNKHVLGRERLKLPFSDIRQDRPIEEFVEAA